MTAAEVRDSLALRWPDGEFLAIAEAPEDSSRQGRKIDLLVVSLWQSRGLEVQAVEIKVSVSDWKRELQRAEKADFWWRHSNRFWLAVPAPIAAKVKPDLPPGWGLLACETGKQPKVVVQAERHAAAVLPWPTVVGVLRASADCGLTALRRAEEKGWREGREQGKRQAERASAEGRAAEDLEQLRARVTAFEETSGLSIQHGYDSMEQIGRLVTLIRREQRQPGWIARNLGNAASYTVQRAEHLVLEARAVEELARVLAEVVATPTEQLPEVERPAVQEAFGW